MRKFLTLLLLLTLYNCQSESRKASVNQSQDLMSVVLTTPSNEEIKTLVAMSNKDQEQGLSGVQPDDFSEADGMLFYYLTDDTKHFWMPDTYFDLDLFYLDRDLVIVDIIRKLPHYIGRHNEALIPRARPVYSRHTLEMKSGSKIAEKLKVGDRLTWKGSVPLEKMDEIATKLQNL